MNGKLHDLTITIDKKVLRQILDDYWKQYNDSFKVDLHKNRYYLHLIKTELHGYWTEIPDDTIFFIVRMYYTLSYPHQDERIIKRADRFVFMLNNIDEIEGDKNGLVEKVETIE